MMFRGWGKSVDDSFFSGLEGGTATSGCFLGGEANTSTGMIITAESTRTAACKPA
jgi:hypothetical protein